MKRTNLIVDEKLLREAKHILDAATYSATVNQALAEVIRIEHLRSLTDFFGKNVWTGDLAQMREDKPSQPAKKERKAR